MGNSIHYYKGKIIDVVKNSKLRWNPAPKGTQGYVVSSFTNQWGTQKLVLIDERGNEYCTTTNCVSLNKAQDKQKFESALKAWVEDTHMPVVFETTIVPSNPSKKAICCKFINKKEVQWLPLSVLKDNNFNPVSLNSFVVNKCYTGYIPLWTAKKMGLVTSSLRTS
jgi:hypothetical protein